MEIDAAPLSLRVGAAINISLNPVGFLFDADNQSTAPEVQLTLRFSVSPSVFVSSMNRAASSSSGQTTPGFVFPSASCNAPVAAA
jgi:hypothetical protein